MFDGCDPRDNDRRDRDEGIRDHEEDWLRLGRGPGSAALREDYADDDTRDRDEDWRQERDRDSHNRDDNHGGDDPRDVFMRYVQVRAQRVPQGRPQAEAHIQFQAELSQGRAL